MKKILVLAVMCGLVLAAACSRETKPPLVGNPAPDFTLRDLSGREVRLADFRGKVVMLNFWASWCPPCREEIPSMMRLNRLMAGKPFQMLAVSIDEGGAAAVTGFFQRNGVELPALLDPARQVSGRYGSFKVPETYIIDKNGVILKKVIGSMAWDQPEVVAFLEQAAGK